MEVYDCIKSRRSIRKFLDVPVEWDKVSKMLDAARLAPSAGNLQAWSFLVVTNKNTIRKIAESALQQFWIETAPIVIVVMSQPDKVAMHYGLRGERLYAIQDGAAAIQNILLMAKDQGLGACWVGAFDEEMLKRACEIPDEIRPQAIIPVGYPDEEVPEPAKYQLVSLVSFETFGNKIRHPSLWPIGDTLEKHKAKLKVYTEKAAEKLKEKSKKILGK